MNQQSLTAEEQKQLLFEAQQLELAYREQSKTDFMCFARGLMIPSQDKSVIMLEEVLAPFQLSCFEDLAPAVTAVRNGEKPPRWQRFWIERTKKASKDADLAIIILWLVAFPIRPIFIQVGAGNREQAAIVKERLSNLLHHNEWLNEFVEVHESRVRSKKQKKDGTPLARCDIMSADGSGAHGGTPDVAIINELTHIKDQNWDFADTMMDNADGVAHGLVIIATNAGYLGSEAEKWRDSYLKMQDRWCFHVLSEPAPWTSPGALKDAEIRNPRGRFNRLWHGVWEPQIGDVIDPSYVNQCFTLEGEEKFPSSGWVYLAGLDLGVKHDHSGLVVLAVNPKLQEIRTAYMRAWKPEILVDGKKEVNLSQVEESCIEVWKRYRISCLLYDPSQAKLLSQRLTKRGIYTQELTFTTANMVRMATAWVQALQGGKLKCYDIGGRLKADFYKFKITPQTYGMRLEAVSDNKGHADLGTALIIALPAAMDMLNGVQGLDIEGEIISTENTLTKEEIKQLPQEFKDLFDEKKSQTLEDEYLNYGDYFDLN